MSDNMEKDGGAGKAVEKPESLTTMLEQTATRRAAYSRCFLESVGKSADNLVEELKKKPFEITIDAADDKSLTMGIFELQKKLGFPEEDHAKGCDGKFGPYTKRVYEGFGVGKKAGVERSGVMDDVGAGGGDAVASDRSEVKPIPSGDNAPSESVDKPVDSKLEPVKISETVFVGDSLTYLMSSSLNGAEKVVKGGKQTGWMKENFNKFLAERANGQHQNVKRVAILGGFNDLTSLKSLESIKANLSAMYKAAKDAGLTVVACTIPEWNYEAGLKTFQRDFAKFRWHGGVYPLSAAELEKRTKELNEWILAQAADGHVVVDLFREMNDKQKYKRGDFVHLYGKSAANMAALIKERGRIID